MLLLQQLPKPQQSGCIRYLFLQEIDPYEVPHHVAVVDRISQQSALLDTFVLQVLPNLLEAAAQKNASYKQLLLSIFETEVKIRNARRQKRNCAATYFPPKIPPLEMFNPLELESGITQAQLNRLKELNWLDNKGNLIFSGPPLLALGKPWWPAVSVWKPLTADTTYASKRW